jgi:hypothetical protein
MGVIVAFGRRKAILRNGDWRSSDQDLEVRLNALTRSWVEESGGPSLASPDPERDAALEIARRAGGRLVLHAVVRGRRSHRAWFAHRQYRLAFN